MIKMSEFSKMTGPLQVRAPAASKMVSSEEDIILPMIFDSSYTVIHFHRIFYFITSFLLFLNPTINGVRSIVS